MGDVGLRSFRDILGRYNLGEVTVKSNGKLDLYNHHQKLTIFNGRNISNETRLEARATFVRALETSLRAHYGNDGMLSEAHIASRTGTKIAGRYDRVGVDNRGQEKVLLSVNFPESFQNIRHSPVRHDVRMTWEADFQEKYQSLAPATRKAAEEVQNI